MDKTCKERYCAFWARKAADRPLLHFTAPKNGITDALPLPKTPAQKWSDIEFRMKEIEYHLVNTLCFGDAFHNAWVNLGPGALASMIGSGHTWAWDTVWFGETHSLIQSWDELDGLCLLKDSEMYRLATAMTEAFARQSAGRYITGLCDLGGNMDILASLRGTQDLLFDLYDNPEEVKKALRWIDDIWEVAFAHLHSITKRLGEQGMSSWIPLWCEKRFYPLQCDFSAMISPGAFNEFVMPSLVRIAAFLDHSIYHLDGPGELPHLDSLLSIDRLDGIQWTPGDGRAPVASDEWFPLYEKIQKSGKNLVLLGIDTLDDALKLVKHLSPRGLYLQGWLKSAEEGDALVRKTAELMGERPHC